MWLFEKRFHPIALEIFQTFIFRFHGGFFWAKLRLHMSYEDIQRFRQVEKTDAMKVLEIHRFETRGRDQRFGDSGAWLKGVGFNVKLC